jgi:hypothetical protein
MPELPFPDLATPAERATQPPPFEQVVGRARQQRRRRVVAAATVTAAAVVAVVVGAALGTGDQQSTPTPSKPSVSPVPPPDPSGSSAPTTAPDAAVDPDTIIRTGHLASFAAGPGGSLLTVWQACTEGELLVCHAAWQLDTPHGMHRGLASGDSPVVHAAGNAFVVKAWNRTGIVVSADGSVRSVVDSGPGANTRDSALVYGRSGLLVVDGRTARAWPLPRIDGLERWNTGVITSDGTTWTTGTVDGAVWVAWLTGNTWQHHVMPAPQGTGQLPGYVAAAGDHVASVSGYDGATILPVADLAVTTDAGQTWTDLHQSDLPFTYVDAIAATPGGTLYVLTEDGHGGRGLFRSIDRTWTRFAQVPDAHHLEVLEPAADGVLAQGGTNNDPELFTLDDAGRATPVPIAR